MHPRRVTTPSKKRPMNRTEQAVEIMRSMRSGVEDASFYWAAIILEGIEAQRLLANLVWAADEKGWEGKAWDEARDYFNRESDLVAVYPPSTANGTDLT
jgi:hypothetical protein